MQPAPLQLQQQQQWSHGEQLTTEHVATQQATGQPDLAQAAVMQLLSGSGAAMQQRQAQVQYQVLLSQQQQQMQSGQLQRAGVAKPPRQQQRAEPVKVLRLIPQRSAKEGTGTAQERS
jgi:hypothetical protein